MMKISLLLAAVLALPPQASQTQNGTITGQLLHERGTPAVGVRVAAMPVPREGDSGVPTLLGLGLTDSNGRYTLEMLEPGTYYVTAGRIDTPSYYPGVGKLSAAKSILVTAGARVSDIDFKTFEPQTYVASGRVVLQPGQNLAPGSRMILVGAGSHEQTIKPDGTFEFSRVLPARYSLRLVPETFSVAMPIVVEDQNVTGLEFTVPAVVTVNASVAMEDGSGPPNVTMSFVDIKQNKVLEVTARRSFSVLVPEGEFRATAKRVPNGYSVKSFTAGGVDLRSNSLKLSSTETVIAVAMTLEAVPTVAFAGRAVSSRGVLQPMRSIRMESGEGVESLQGTVQSDSSFVFDRVAPGEYTAALLVAGAEELKVKVTVPPEGRRDGEIVIPELRQLSVRLGMETNVPAAARPVVTLRFVEAAGGLTPLAVDGSSAEAPLKFSLREGQYRVTATIREAVAGAGTTQVKTLTSGPVNLLTSPFNIGGGDLEEIRITIGR